jgi:hypothetical protein
MTRPLDIALDLEGTLVSNAMSQIPRAHLREFLEFCLKTFERVVIYSAVNPKQVRMVCQKLVEMGDAPEWFGNIEIFRNRGKYKDLTAVAEDFRWVLLVDDVHTYVDPKQASQWVPCEQFCRPYGPDDELLAVMEEIKRRLDNANEEDSQEA